MLPLLQLAVRMNAAYWRAIFGTKKPGITLQRRLRTLSFVNVGVWRPACPQGNCLSNLADGESVK